MTKPPTDREVVLQLARAARKRLNAIIGAVADDDVDAAEVENVVRGVHRVVVPVRRVGKLQRWLLLARVVEVADAKTPTASDADIARRAVAKYGITFPHVALGVAKVEAFVHAWRTDRNYFKALRSVLVDHWPTEELVQAWHSALQLALITRAAVALRYDDSGIDERGTFLSGTVYKLTDDTAHMLLPDGKTVALTVGCIKDVY